MVKPLSQWKSFRHLLNSKKSPSHIASEPELISAFRKKYAITLLILVAMLLGVIMIIIMTSAYTSEKTIIDNSIKYAFKNPAISGGINILGDPSKLSPRKDFSESSGNGALRKTVPVFVLRVDQEGTIINVESSDNVRMRPDILANSIAYAINNTYYNGYIANYKLFFSIEETPSGYHIAFVDARAFIKDMRNLALTCAISFVCIMIVFLFISLWISKLAVRPVEEAWETQKRFIADASHELKTPLAVISANMDIIMKHPESQVAEQLKWLNSTKSEIKSMQALVQDLLALSKLQTQTRDLLSDTSRQQQVDLSELIQKSVLQFEVLAFEKHASLAETIQANLKVKGIPDELERLIKILLDNACKYVNENGSIQLDLSATGTSCILSVNNSGNPIPQEDLQNIFKRFYRSDSSRQRKSGGYGLGLAIAYAIVHKHGGLIKASSDEQYGTTFFVELPLDRQTYQ